MLICVRAEGGSACPPSFEASCRELAWSSDEDVPVTDHRTGTSSEGVLQPVPPGGGWTAGAQASPADAVAGQPSQATAMLNSLIEASAPKGPALGTFPKQLLANFGGMFAGANLRPLLIGSAATGSAALLDDEVQGFSGSTRRFQELGEVGEVIGGPLTLGAFSGGMLVTGYLSENGKLQALGYSLAQGFLVNGAMTAALKTAVSRDRPDGKERAFPSGHTSATFTMATVVSHYYPKLTIPLYALAGLVGASRLEQNKHWFSDVAAGATLGYIVGKTVVRGTDSLTKNEHLVWAPFFGPDGSAGLVVHYTF